VSQLEVAVHCRLYNTNTQTIKTAYNALEHLLGIFHLSGTNSVVSGPRAYVCKCAQFIAPTPYRMTNCGPEREACWAISRLHGFWDSFVSSSSLYALWNTCFRVQYDRIAIIIPLIIYTTIIIMRINDNNVVTDDNYGRLQDILLQHASSKTLVSPGLVTVTTLTELHHLVWQYQVQLMEWHILVIDR
jgi:hypothetical protein